MINEPKESLLRLDEYLTYLGSAFRNRFAAHTELSEGLATLIENLAELTRHRMQAVDFRQEFARLTGRLADLLGIYSVKFNSKNVTSLLWMLFLQWANDLINLGANYSRSVDLFNDLFNSQLELNDGLNPLRGYDERLNGKQFAYLVQMRNTNFDPKFDGANFDQLFSTFRDILPCYLLFDVTIVVVLRDELYFTEEGEDPPTVQVSEFVAFRDLLTFDFMHTGPVAIFIRDLGNFDASVGGFGEYQNLRVGDWLRVIRDGSGPLSTLVEGDTLVAKSDLLGVTPTLADFDVYPDYLVEIEPHSHESLALSAVELDFNSGDPLNAALKAAATAAVLAMDRQALPAPVELQWGTYLAPLDMDALFRPLPGPTPDDNLYALTAHVGIRGNAVWQTLRRTLSL